MGQTLTNGIYLPDEGERNSYSGLEANWRTLDALILTVNGKAAPNVANTWTAAQTFNAGIAGDLTGNVTGNVTGDLTGTASRAIADEDGTSIKTGYVNVAGNQTVTGQKTWSGVNYFNNESLYQIATNPRYAFKSSILEIGVQPSGHCTATVDWLDSNDAELGYSRFVEYNDSIQTYEVLLKNKAENGSLSPAGNDISASLQLALFKTGSSQLNLGVDTVVPTSNNSASLGSSSYQWSSVYAQTYYYNGTQWGLDQANVWTNTNTYTNNFYFKDSTVVKGTAVTLDKAQNIWDVTDSNNASFGAWQAVQYSNNRQGFRLAVSNNYLNGALDPTGTSIPTYFQFLQTSGSAILKWNDGFVDNNVLPIANSSYSLGSAYFCWSAVYADTYYYGTTAWGLDKANTWSQNQSVANASTPKFILKDTRNDRTYSVTDKTGGVMIWECDDKDDAPLSRISTTLRQDKVVQLQFAIFNEDSTGTEFDRTIRFAVGNTGSAVYYPEQTGNVELGDSSHKWKTLNGINPGALSLPGNSYIDISGDITVRDGSVTNSYTAPCDGWIAIQSFATWLQISNDTLLIATTAAIGADGFAQAFLPVRKGNAIRVMINQTNTQFQSFKLLPCEGNV